MMFLLHSTRVSSPRTAAALVSWIEGGGSKSDGRGQECRRSGTIEGLKPLSDDHDDVLAARLSDGRGHECRRSGIIEGRTLAG